MGSLGLLTSCYNPLKQLTRIFFVRFVYFVLFVPLLDMAREIREHERP